MEGINFDVGLNTSGFTSQINNMTTSLGKVESVAKGISTALLAIGGAAVTQALSGATKAFTDWEKSFANVQTMMEDVPGVSEQWKSSLADIGKEYGKMSAELNEAAYTFLSATGGKGTTQQFEQFVKASVAGYTDINTAVEVGLAANNAFNVSMEELSWTLDTLNRVVQKGQTDWSKLNQAVQRSAPNASTAGMSFAELGAVFATFSGKTGQTAEVATQLNSVIKGLINPTETMKETLVQVIKPMVETGKVTGNLAEEFQALWDAGAAASGELGTVATGLVSAAIEGEGFANFLTQIIDTAEGNQGVLAEMFGRQEALLLLNAWMKNLDEFTDAQSAVEDSTGSLDESFKKHEETLSFFYEKMAATSEKMKESLGGLLAEVGQPIFEKLGEGMEKWTERLQKATEDFATWKEDLANSEGFGSDLTKALLGAAPLAVPISFAVAAGQKGLGSMLQNIGGFGEGVKVVGGKIVGAAGTAAMSMGISIAINKIQKGEDLEEVGIQQAIAGALGIAAGMVGGAAAGQLVYGITVAITDIILTKSPEDYFEDLRLEGMKSIDIVADAEPTQASKDNFIEQYKELTELTKKVIGDPDWEIRLTTDEKQILADVQEYTAMLGEELKKDPVEMDLSKIKEGFAETSFLLDSLTEDFVTSTEEMNYFEKFFELRDDVFGEAQSTVEKFNKEMQFITSAGHEDYAQQMYEATQASVRAISNALKENPEDVESTLNQIMETTKGAFEKLDLSDVDFGNAMSVVTEAYENALGNIDKVIKETADGGQEIEIKINTKSIAEQLQTAINSTSFEQVYNIDDFVSQIESLDLENTVGLKPDDSEIKSAILALDMTPVTLLFQPDTSAITSFINQLKIEMGVEGSEGESKASGGYTAPVGRNTPAGIVHGGEWVAPAWMVQDSKFSRAIESLEQARTNRGYASGGTVMPQQTNQQTLVFNFNGQLIQDDPESKRKIAEWVHESFKEAGAMA
ncbi:MAG: phage tail tape measure protein [Bacteroidales bacterium]|nr:phage tail tape measure protein [Bacteroidales bacterium]